MASPPYNSYSPSALSPPYASHTQLPPLNTLNMNKKRTAADNTPAPALKRRKASTLSVASTGSAHPLRQTSFPPDEIGTPLTMRSPSVDIDNVSLVSGSQVSGAPAKKKRGRKSKAEKAREQTPSVAGGRAPTAVSGVSGPKSNVGGAGEGEEDDGEGDDPDTEMIATKRSDHDKQEERRLRAALVNCLDADQAERIAAWRATKLPDSVIKRLVNATVSQSVPASVVTAVRTVTKYFLTDLIAKAHRVQDEWIEANDEKQADMEWPGKVVSRDGPEVEAQFEEQAKLPQPQVADLKDVPELILKELPKGPLRPDHMREAWRRYKATNQSQGSGTLGLWHVQQSTGAERFPVRTGGRRIFK